jgi:hypothetical protein
MKKLPRWMALAAIFTVALSALPSASAMDTKERVVTTQTELIRHPAHHHHRHHHHHHRAVQS